MFTLLLSVLMASALATPLISLVGRRLKHKRVLVSVYAVLVLLCVFLLSINYLLGVIGGNLVLTAYGVLPLPERSRGGRTT